MHYLLGPILHLGMRHTQLVVGGAIHGEINSTEPLCEQGWRQMLRNVGQTSDVPFYPKLCTRGLLCLIQNKDSEPQTFS